jgi:hypothetical protein
MTENTYITEKSFEYKELTITSSDGNSYDIYPQLIELSMFEDIYNSTISGSVLLSDSVELFSMIPLTGFEFLNISIVKPGYSKETIFEKTFRVYKMVHNEIDQSSRSNQTYTLHFCSEENLVSLSRLISKSYNGVSSSFIIKDILKNELGVSRKKFDPNEPKNIEESSGRQNIIIPYLHPLQAANWITTRSISLSSKNSTANFMFYENREGYNFKSLEKLFLQPTRAKYTFKQKNVEIKDESIIDEYRDVIKYEIMNTYDVVKAMSQGMFSSTFKGVDLVRLRADDIVLDYNDFFNKSVHLHNDKQEEFKQAYPFHNEYEDRLQNKVYKNYFATRRMYPTNKDHDIIKSISSKQSGIKPNLVERWMLQRMSQISQLNYFKIKLVLPGDTYLTVGDIIEFKMPLIRRHLPGETNDNPYHSGRYLITAIRHKLDYQNYEMIVEATRDCLSSKLPESNNNDPYLRELKKL